MQFSIRGACGRAAFVALMIAGGLIVGSLTAGYSPDDKPSVGPSDQGDTYAPIPFASRPLSAPWSGAPALDRPPASRSGDRRSSPS